MSWTLRERTARPQADSRACDPSRGAAGPAVTEVAADEPCAAPLAGTSDPTASSDIASS